MKDSETTIPVERVLSGTEWAIVSTDERQPVYGTYHSADEAERICADLNKRYGESAYQWGRISFDGR